MIIASKGREVSQSVIKRNESGVKWSLTYIERLFWRMESTYA